MRRRERVDGSPFQRGEIVRVVGVTDADIHDVSRFVGRLGLVDYLEYDCGAGQSYPRDPMIGVRFPRGDAEEFWPEELAAARKDGVK